MKFNISRIAIAAFSALGVIGAAGMTIAFDAPASATTQQTYQYYYYCSAVAQSGNRVYYGPIFSKRSGSVHGLSTTGEENRFRDLLINSGYSNFRSPICSGGHDSWNEANDARGSVMARDRNRGWQVIII